MIRFGLALSAAFFISVSAVAQEPSAPAINLADKPWTGLSWGATWGLLSSGYLLNLDLATPALIKYGKSDENRIALYAELGTTTLKNLVSGSGGRLQDATSVEYVIGMRISSLISDHRPFVNIGYDRQMWDPDLNPNGRSASGALILSLGHEFLYKLPETSYASAFVIQMDYRSGHDGADRIAGEPDYFDGVAIRLGGRLVY